MEKAVSLFKDGERMTPIMQKIEDLRSAITRYNRVTAKRAKPKIGFAYGIILFADDELVMGTGTWGMQDKFQPWGQVPES